MAKKLGSALAHVQDGVDQLVSLGFKVLKKTGGKEVKETDHPVKKTLKKTASFLGETGESFYETYEEIKERRKGKKDK